MYKVKFTSFSGSGQPTKMAPRICGFAAVRCILVLLNSVYVVSLNLWLSQHLVEYKEALVQ